MGQMQDKKHSKPNKKPSRTTLIMAAGLLGILLIGIAPMLRQHRRRRNTLQQWKAAWRAFWDEWTE